MHWDTSRQARRRVRRPASGATGAQPTLPSARWKRRLDVGAGPVRSSRRRSGVGGREVLHAHREQLLLACSRWSSQSEALTREKWPSRPTIAMPIGASSNVPRNAPRSCVRSSAWPLGASVLVHSPRDHVHDAQGRDEERVDRGPLPRVGRRRSGGRRPSRRDDAHQRRGGRARRRSPAGTGPTPRSRRAA